jgi:hypothetical protein
MRKLTLMGALAVIGFAIPMTLPADAATVVIKKNRGHHYGCGRRDHDRKTVISHRGDRDHDRKTVIVRHGERD